jgi:hypothetical protein
MQSITFYSRRSRESGKRFTTASLVIHFDVEICAENGFPLARE